MESPRDQRIVMYRISKSRSQSVGSGITRARRRAEFQDSEVVTVNSHSATEILDSEKIGGDIKESENQIGGDIKDKDDMVSTKGFARLDVVSSISFSAKK